MIRIFLKSLRYAAVLLVLMPPAAPAGNPAPALQPSGDQESMQVKKDLEKLERLWIETTDMKVLGSIVADDFLYTDADANILNKRQYLNTVEKLKMKKSETNGFNIRVYGHIAIVLNTWSGTYTFDNGPEITETLRYTDVFIKRNGAWQAISSQAIRKPAH